MKRGTFLLGLLSLTMAAPAKSPFTGMWEGKLNDLPGVDLTIEDTGGKISGTVGFYLQLRGDDGKRHVEDKYTVALLAPTVDGNVLAFEVIHHKKHGSPELGPNVKFRMELTGENEAVLHRVSHQPDAGSDLKLTRRIR